MTETLDSCPVCNKEAYELFLVTKDHSITQESFNLVVCKNCDFVFTNPRPDEKSISFYYESPNYISHSSTNEGLINKLYKLVRTYSSKKKLALIEKYAGSDKTILDFGCGTGSFLNECKSNGWSVKGIEPNKQARELARKEYNLVINDESEIENINPKSFQIITLWHVLEHVHNLRQRIKDLSRLLKNDGKIFIALPNYTSYDATHYKEFWAGFDVPRHLYHFSGKSIRNLFEQLGFSFLKSIPMKFDSYYVSILSEKYKGNKVPIIKGSINGLISNLKAGKDPEKYSSVIYVFVKS